MKIQALLTSALLICALPCTALANVIIVAPSGGDFTQIQDAVDAALEADTILVKSGTYESFVVSNKALSIVGDSGSSVHVHGAVRVRNLATDKTLVLQNLKATGFQAASVFTRYGLYAVNSSGHVRVEACEFIGSDGVLIVPGGSYGGVEAVRLEQCGDVSLTRTLASGGAGVGTLGINNQQGSGAGLRALGSTVTIYDSTLRGGDGESGYAGAHGGHGLWASSSSAAFASGTSFEAGNGGDGTGGACIPGASAGYGGYGILLQTSTVALFDTVEQGGTAGIPGSCTCCDWGEDGAPRNGFGFSDLAGISKQLLPPSPVREMTSATLVFNGAPGDQVDLLLARTTDYAFELDQSGALLVGSPMRILHLGSIPPSGTLTINLPLFSLGAVPSIRLYLQALFTDAQLTSTLGTPSTMLILNQLY